MSNSTQNTDQEIDLSQLGKGISNFFQNIINKCFDVLFFVWSKKIIIAALFVIGVILGYFLDSGNLYKTNINVYSNFGSVEYLYNKAEILETKAARNDEAFFNSIGIKNSKDIISIEIEPIPGAFSLISDKNNGAQSFELIKLMAEDGDLNKILEDKNTTKNYPLHQLIIKTKNQYKIEEMVNPLLKYFNDNDYFNKQQKVHLENIREKIRLNDSLINQVDRLLNQLTAQKSNASISISEQSSIPTLFGKKDDLIKEKQVLKTVEVNYDRIIKDVSITNCIRFFDPIYLRLKVILPLLFVFLYLSGFWFINLVKSQKVRFDLEQKNN